MYPSHLKLNSIAGALAEPEAIGRTASSRQRPAGTIGVPVFLKRWPQVRDVLGGFGVPFVWAWQMVRRLLQRIAALFGVKINAPLEPPGTREPAAEFVAADGGDEVATARNLADASSVAASKADDLLRRLLESMPDREALKDAAAPAMLAGVLGELGPRLQQMRIKEQQLLQAWNQALEQQAAQHGLDPLHVLRAAQAGRLEGPLTQLAPLWEEVQTHRALLKQTRDRFADYCILALREPDLGIEQEAVEAVVQRNLELWGDEQIRERVRAGVAAPSLDSALVIDAETRIVEDEPDAAAEGGAAAKPGGGEDRFGQMMGRFKKMGAVEDDDQSPAATPT